MGSPARVGEAFGDRSTRSGGGEPPPAVWMGQALCSDLEVAGTREWLVTNGIGGYASGTVAGPPTRRYHGLLVAATAPPVGRRMLVSRVEESLDDGRGEIPLASIRWGSGTVSPHGYRHLVGFRLEGTSPVWTWAVGSCLLEKRVWMTRGSNTTWIRYDVIRASSPVTLRVDVFLNHRDHHGVTHAGDWRFTLERRPDGLRALAYEGAVPVHVIAPGAELEIRHDWYRDHDLPVERHRGLEDREDQLLAARLTRTLRTGDPFLLAVSTEEAPLPAETSWRSRGDHENELLERFAGEAGERSPDWIRQLALAADQFIVDRPAGGPGGKTLLAGYPWFGDWGRDTMIALPGITLATGRPRVAAEILRTFARFVDQGMLPNYFPDAGQSPEYNTADATLWYFEAIRLTDAALGGTLAPELVPVLEEMVAWHERGTRYGIRVDPADGLLRAGEPGWQLTWMDARADGKEVTPRIGKPVEVNALWMAALATLAGFQRRLGRDPAHTERLLGRAKAGFRRFWNPDRGYSFDVLDGPAGNDPSLRPNQILAVSLPVRALPPEQERSIVEACGRELLTPFGLRSLGPGEPGYAPRYAGGPSSRDGAYHQGTVWGWLLGPYVEAYLRVGGDSATAATFLEPMRGHLLDQGLGTGAEIFDAEAPFTPRGCLAQAWTVAEVLRAWSLIHAPSAPGRPPSPVKRQAGMGDKEVSGKIHQPAGSARSTR